MPTTALLFDFDGVIVDTETPEVELWRAIFERYQVPFPDALWQQALGRGADAIEEMPMDALARLVGPEFDREAAEVLYRDRREAWVAAAPTLPGVEELAAEAREAGWRVAIVSSSDHAWVDGHLARLGLNDLFEFTVCREDAPRAKPFPDLYLEAVSRLGVTPSEVIALEDSPNGAAAAVAAGLFCVAVPNRLTADLDLDHAHARLDGLENVGIATLLEIRRLLDEGE